jgi:hypothetical protein
MFKDSDDQVIPVQDLRDIADLGRTPGSASELEASVRARLHREMAGTIEAAETARTPRRRLRPKLLCAVGGIAAAAIIGGVALGTGGSGNVLSPATAEAAPLLKLTSTLAAQPAPTGDATLTIEHYPISGNEHYTSYNLITDKRFLNYFGQTREQLRTASAVSPTGPGKATGRGTVSGWITAASKASDQTPEQAAQAILDSSGIPNMGKDAAGRLAQRNNHVWITALAAIELAGGRPDVRAGALKAMSAIGAEITQDTLDGRAVMRVTVHEEVGGKDYVETLTIDATTGTPIHFTGGTGKDAANVTYEVSRVNAADFGH